MSDPSGYRSQLGDARVDRRLVASLLLEQGIPVRALVHKLDARSDGYVSRARRWSRATS